MCKERASPKCCVDNLLLIFIILIIMLLYMYIETKNIGLIVIIIIIAVFFLVLFSIRLEECGFPDWINNCIKIYKNVCKDKVVDNDETAIDIHS